MGAFPLPTQPAAPGKTLPAATIIARMAGKQED
jgi:hypothetical protein